MSFDHVHQFKFQVPQPSWSTSQSAPRLFSTQEPKRLPTQEQLENQAFQQDKFEVTGLQLKEKSGTITPVEQEKLGMLQAKMDSFWAQRMEKAKAQPNLLEILIRNAQASPTLESATPVQPKLAIGEPDDQYEQEADQAVEQVMKMSAPPDDSQPQTSQNLVQRKSLTPGTQQPPGFAHLDLFSHVPRRRPPINALQSKLAIGRPNDVYEQEADRITDQMMITAPPATPNIQRQTGPEESEEIQRKPATSVVLSQDASVHNFNQARVHSGNTSAGPARAVNAPAYTAGRDVVFESGQYTPGTREGKRPLAHELAPSVQQNMNGNRIQKQDTPGQSTITSSDTQQGSAHPECYGRTLSQAEIQQRLAIYQDFVRGVTGEISQRENILIAMCSFSLDQLTRMQEAGVRFWPAGSLPPLRFPEGTSIEVPGRGLSSYNPALRVIRLSIRASSALRHELAHAWDHVSVMPRRFRLDDLSGRRLERAVTASQPLASHAGTQHEITLERGQIRMTLEQMYDAYRERMRGMPRDQAFGTPVATEGYSLESVEEFYAEGYAVFNSTLTDQQATMRRQAPELYEFLRQQAVGQHLPIPDAEALEPSTVTP